MEAVPLLLSLAALAIVSMDLALSIIWNRRARYTWSRTCVVFTATLMGAVVVFVLDQYSSIMFSGQLQLVLHYIWEGLMVADSTFIIAMLPVFASWIIARPRGTLEKVIPIVLAALYLAVSILQIITDRQLFSLFQYMIWTIAVTYCVVIMIVFGRSVSDKSVRIMCRTLAIISISMIPLVVLACIYTSFRAFSIALVSMAYSIAFLVFLFIATAHQEKNDKAMTTEYIQETYHITDREIEVIKLIKAGYTNKEIAYELSISVNTVNNHIANIFSKTEVRSRIDLLNLLQEASW